jgi:transposase-like protein
MDAPSQMLLSSIYAIREGSTSVLHWFAELKAKGLDPIAITMDGEQSTMKAIRLTWPMVKIQRCLLHIQMQGLSWIRTYPKTQAGKDLKILLLQLCRIHSVKERNDFLRSYKKWLYQYKDFILSLPKTEVAFKDLKRTTSLIKNALPDMFHYLVDPNIPYTTNMLESFYSRLKAAYQRHRGLTHHHKMQFLNWYCYFENQHKTNTF